MASKTKTGCCPAPKESILGKPIIGKDAETELSQLAKALSHPARVRIVKMLVAKQSCICGEIVEELAMPQSTVSQHLKVLKDVGLIRGDIDGPKTCYCITLDMLQRFKILAAAL